MESKCFVSVSKCLIDVSKSFVIVSKCLVSVSKCKLNIPSRVQFSQQVKRVEIHIIH